MPARAFLPDLLLEGDSFRAGRAVVVEDGVIVDVCDPPPLGEDVRRERLEGMALIPGTINAHGHAFQSLLKGRADDLPFDRWRDEVLYPLSERVDASALYAGALFAFAEALLAGATTTVDFLYLHDGGNDNAELIIKAAKDVGIRLVLARAFYDLDAPTKAPARYREAAHDAAMRTSELVAAHAGDPFVYVQPAPHSLHAASPATIAAALDVARSLDCPCHLHLAEAAYEVRQVRERYGTTPVRLLEREGLLDRRLVGVHAVWLDDAELDLLAAAGVGVVHCPAANAFLGDGIARVPEMLSRGITVALGPDGGCANNRQSVLDEMRTASLLAKARLTDGGAMDTGTAFALGTRSAAALLGVRAGAVEVGHLADFVALDLMDLSLQPIETLERQLVNSMQPTAIARVYVGGEVVVADGELTRVSRESIAARVRAATSSWEYAGGTRVRPPREREPGSGTRV